MKEELEALELRFANGEITEAEYHAEKALLLDSMAIDEWLDGAVDRVLPEHIESILHTLQPKQEQGDFESVFTEVSRGTLVEDEIETADSVDDLFMDLFESVEAGPLASKRNIEFVDTSDPLQFEGQVILEETVESSEDLTDGDVALEQLLDGEYPNNVSADMADTIQLLSPKEDPNDFESMFTHVSRGPFVDQGTEGLDAEDDLFMEMFASVETGPLASNRDADVIDDSEPLQFNAPFVEDAVRTSVEPIDHSVSIESWLDGDWTADLPNDLGGILTQLQSKVEPDDFESVFANVSHGPLSDVVDDANLETDTELLLEVMRSVEVGPLAEQRQSLEDDETALERAAELLFAQAFDEMDPSQEEVVEEILTTSAPLIAWSTKLKIVIPSIAAAAALVVVLPGTQSSSDKGLPESDTISPKIELMAYRSGGKPTLTELDMQMESLGKGQITLDDVQRRYTDLNLEYSDTTDWGTELLSLAESYQVQLAVGFGVLGEKEDIRIPSILQTARYNVQKLKLRSEKASTEAYLARARKGMIGNTAPEISEYLNLRKLTNKVRRFLQQDTAEAKRLLSIANGQTPAETQLEQLEANRAMQLKLLLIELNISLDDLGEE